MFPQRRRRVQSNDQGRSHQRKPRPRCRVRQRSRGRCAGAGRAFGYPGAEGRARASGCLDVAGGARARITARAQNLVVAVGATAAVAAWLSGQMEWPAPGAPAGIGQGQPALADDDPGAALERATTLFAVASHAPRTAATIAPALATIQEHAARTAAAGARILQAISANTAAKAHGITPAMAADESRAAPRGHAAAAAAAAQYAIADAAPTAVLGHPWTMAYHHIPCGELITI